MRRLLLGLLLGALAALSGSEGASAYQSPAYVALGDSLAFGLGSTNPGSDGYVALVHHTLQKSERYRNRGLELRNLAIPGARSEDLLLEGGQLDQAIEEIRERAENADSGDEVELITLGIGGNDLLALGQAGSPCADDPLGEPCQERFNTTLKAYEETLSQILRKLRKEQPEAEIIAVTLYNPFSGRGGEAEIPGDLAITLLNGAMQAVASSPDVRAKVADLFPRFRGKGNEYIAADGLHANSSGHQVIAEAVLAALEGRMPAATPAPIDGGIGGSLLPNDTSANSDDGMSLGLLLAIVIPSAAVGTVVIGGAYWLARGRP